MGRPLLLRLSRDVERISRNAARLDKMILDVLTFSRIARAEIQLERVSLNRLIAELVQNYPAMQLPRARIEILPLHDVQAHEPSLIQVLSNLLGNAVKFVAPGVQPHVRISSERANDYVTLSVQDNGIGVSPAYHHRLFNMFERIHPDLEYEGNGVGLGIVKKAVERMGGRVGIESDEHGQPLLDRSPCRRLTGDLVGRVAPSRADSRLLEWVGRVAPSRADSRLFHNSKEI